MEGFHRAKKVDQVGSGKMTLVMVAGEMVLLANVGGTFYAVSALCTHEGALLPYGSLQGEEVTCPLHFACFNITTGEVQAGLAQEALQRYAVKVEGEDILIGPSATE